MEIFEMISALFEFVSQHAYFDLSNSVTRTILMIIIGFSIFFADDISKLVKKFSKKKKTDDEDTTEDTEDTGVKSGIRTLDLQVVETKNLLSEHHNMSRDMMMRFHVRLDRLEDQVDDAVRDIKHEISEMKHFITNHLPSKYDVSKMINDSETDND